MTEQNYILTTLDPPLNYLSLYVSAQFSVGKIYWMGIF